MIKKINKFNLVLFICGTAIFFLLGIIAKISKLLPSDDFEKDCVPVFVSFLIAAAAVYFVSVWKFRKNTACSLILIILFGLGFRILFIPSTPILENDFYRYMWDGAVSSSGVNPYEYSPRQVIDGESPEKLKTLKREHEETLKKINHPHVKTIYPPVSQFFFALSYKLSPMSLEAWRIILILFDLTTLGLLLLSLGKLKIPLQSSIVYWWNPLLVKEIFNSAHMDVVAFPFVLAAIFLFLSGSKRICVLILSLAAGVKLWPALLFGLFIKPFREKRETVLRILIFTAALLVIFLPLIVLRAEPNSGVLTYGKSWQNNSPLFSVILYLWEAVFSAFEVHRGHAQKYSRIAVVLILLLWNFYVLFAKGSLGIYRKALLIVGGAFLLSPAQFPWYYTWLLPFLCMAPSWGFLSLTALLPLYYLQYYLSSSAGQAELFRNVVVWIEFAPVWVLLVWEWKAFRSTGTETGLSARADLPKR